MPAMSFASVPTYAWVPTVVRPRTNVVTAQSHGPAPVPMGCQVPPAGRYATLSAASMFSRSLNPPPAYSVPLLSAASAYTVPAKGWVGSMTVGLEAPLARSQASR
jgi:hypothetical protein